MKSHENQLSRRERQIMDILYRLEVASAEQVRQEMGGKLANATVRMMLRILKEKGQIDFRKEGARYMYYPVVPVKSAGESALRRLVRTFFSDSPSLTVAALLDISAEDLSEEELDAMVAQIKAKRRSEENND